MKTITRTLTTIGIAALGFSGNVSAASKTYLNKSYTKSAGNSNLGGELVVEAHDKFTQTNNQLNYELSASANGTARVLGYSFKVIDGQAGAGAELQGVAIDSKKPAAGYKLTTSAHGDLVLKACGIVLQDVHKKGSATTTLAAPATPSINLLTLDLLTKVKEVTFASAHFMLGPIPINVRAGASASVAAHGGVTLVAKSGAPALTASMGPSGDVALTASAGVDIWVASGGVEANATIVKVSPTAYATLSATSDFAKGSLDYGLDLKYQGVNGSIKLFAAVDTWLWSDKWTWNIASFGDAMHTLSLIKGDAQLWSVTPTAPAAVGASPVAVK